MVRLRGTGRGGLLGAAVCGDDTVCAGRGGSMYSIRRSAQIGFERAEDRIDRAIPSWTTRPQS